MRYLYLATALAFACAAGSAQASSSIPSPYHGKWARDKAACVDPEMTSAVIISARRLTFYELVVKVQKVEAEPGGVAVSGDFDDAGSDGRGTVHLGLSADRKTLTLTGDLTDTYIRCT